MAEGEVLSGEVLETDDWCECGWRLPADLRTNGPCAVAFRCPDCGTSFETKVVVHERPLLVLP